LGKSFNLSVVRCERSTLLAAPGLSSFVPGDLAQLRQLRQSGRSASDAFEKMGDLLTDYFTSIDRLSGDDDIPKAELVAFQAFWPERRELLEARVSEFLSAARGWRNPEAS
jgi:hypothetical protein